MLRKCFTKVVVCQKDTHHANKNLHVQSIWTRSVGNSILDCGRNQDEASEKNRHQATEHSLKLVDPMMVVGQKPGTRISTRVIIFRTRSFRFALISRGRHNLTLIFFLQSIVILTPLSIYPSFTSAFQSLEPGRTQNQDPCHGQYGRLVANSLLVHLTVDR